MQNTVSRKCVYVFLAIAIVGCALDLATKSYYFNKLGMPDYYRKIDSPATNEIILISGILEIETHLNEGALFGIGQGQSFLFAALSLAAAAGIIYWLFWMGAGRDRLLLVSLGCVMAGIMGNLYDRVGMHGLEWEQPIYNQEGVIIHEKGDEVFAVRDWIHFKIDAIDFDWPIFNIADVLLVCGAGMMLLHAFLVKPDPSPTSEAQKSEQ